MASVIFVIGLISFANRYAAFFLTLTAFLLSFGALAALRIPILNRKLLYTMIDRI